MTIARHRPFAPRQIEPHARPHASLNRAHCVMLPLDDGTTASLHLEAAPARDARPGSATRGLPVSTRFGPAVWLDCEGLLLAHSGIDIGRAPTAAARHAFAGYALAALPPGLRAALGDPVIDANAGDGHLVGEMAAALRYELPTLSLAMRLMLGAASLHALLAAGPWQRAPVPTPAWLSALPSQHCVRVAELTMPQGTVSALACGDVVRFPDPAFDVNGRGRIDIFNRALLVRFQQDRHCFEVLGMTDDIPTPARPSTPEPPALCRIDPAALPVQLSFSLGDLNVPLGEVASLRAGSLLPLHSGMPPCVRIEANGIMVGYGELIDLDGRLAVEITQWPDTAPTAVDL